MLRGAAAAMLASSAQAQDVSRTSGALTVIVVDTEGRGIEGARMLLTPSDRIGRSAANGAYVFRNLRPGTYRLAINRLGFSAAASLVVVPDSGALVEIRLNPVAARIAGQVISDRRERIPRVYERQAKRLGHVIFAEDISQYDAFDVPDLFSRVPRFSGLLNAVKSCRNNTIYVDGRNLPPEWKVEEYVRLDEIEAIEVHASADFIREDFLKYSPDPPSPPPPQRIGPITLGTRPPRVGQSLKGTCGRVVMIWTWWYRPPRY